MLRLLRIRGQSMEPDYENGEFVMVIKFPFFFPLQLGHTIVFRLPAYGLLIKRISAIEPDGGVIVSGLHADSIDSRTFGPIKPSAILGRVVWHIRRPRQGK